MLLSLIFGLLIGAAAVIFALQNVFTVTVTFLVWELTASLAVLIILSLIIGIIVSILITIPSAVANYFTIAKLKRENKKLAEVANATKNESEVIVVTEGEIKS